MKKKQVDLILINQTKRQNVVLSFVCVITLIFVLVISFFMIYVKRSKAQYVSYTEVSNIDYVVQYKDNDFFEENILTSNREYIASLIDNINADFNYKISVEDMEVEYKYSYRVEASVSVKNKDNKNLFYDKTEILVPEVENISTSSEVNINEKILIDYNKYNTLIKRFVKVYDLFNAESVLNINMYINVVGSCEEFEDNSKNERVITLSIPLTSDTIAIDFVDNMTSASNNVMKCEGNTNNIIFLILGFVLSVIDLILIIVVIKYEIKTRTAETIYEKKMKKILNNYSSNIQVLSNEFDFSGYQLLKIEDFSDMLEISDKLREPILMKKNKENTGTYFVIPSNSKLLYVFRLKIDDIEMEISKNNNF